MGMLEKTASHGISARTPSAPSAMTLAIRPLSSRVKPTARVFIFNSAPSFCASAAIVSQNWPGPYLG